MKRRKLLIPFLALSLINLIIFYYKDLFHYQPLRDYETLYKKLNPDREKIWSQDYYTSTPLSEKNESKKISTSLFPSQNITDLEKVLLIGNHLHEGFKHRYGPPTDSFVKITPINQYHALN